MFAIAACGYAFLLTTASQAREPVASGPAVVPLLRWDSSSSTIGRPYRETISGERLKADVETLADDLFEGREAGSPGGRAAGNYLLKEISQIGLLPGGTSGIQTSSSYVQYFGKSNRNLLAIVPALDSMFAQEWIVLSAHYDHVGYGKPKNSNGPLGLIHNGADDNASGVAALLEIARALRQLDLRRSILIAFWDGEEQGLLGSKYWLEHPTIDLTQVRWMMNLDMVGRLRDRHVSIYGTRTMTGMRSIWSMANRQGLYLDFPWELEANSDHFPFAQRGIPIAMVHTGPHEDYHRPSDDAELLNIDGMESVCELILETLTVVDRLPFIPAFRNASLHETHLEQAQFYRPAAKRPPRLGVTWEELPRFSGLVVTTVWERSAAHQSGIQPGDRIVSCDGQRISNGRQFRAQLAMKRGPIELELVRTERGADHAARVIVELAGKPLRVGFSWRTDDAEPHAAMVTDVVEDSPAAIAGLKLHDRIYRIEGADLSSADLSSADLSSADVVYDRLRQADGSVSLEVERAGQCFPLKLDLPPAE